MDNQFMVLKEKYDKFQNHLLKNGQFLHKDTVIGYWGVTPLPETYELFKRINLGSYGSMLDLGSGDGRIVLLASLFGVSAKGIEFDKMLINQSLHLKESLSMSNAKFIESNFMDHDFSKYGCIFISPDKPFHRKGLEPKLEKELKGELIVHGWEFHPKMLKRKEEHIINGEKYIIYHNN